MKEVKQIATRNLKTTRQAGRCRHLACTGVGVHVGDGLLCCPGIEPSARRHPVPTLLSCRHTSHRRATAPSPCFNFRQSTARLLSGLLPTTAAGRPLVHVSACMPMIGHRMDAPCCGQRAVAGRQGSAVSSRELLPASMESAASPTPVTADARSWHGTAGGTKLRLQQTYSPVVLRSILQCWS